MRLRQQKQAIYFAQTDGGVYSINFQFPGGTMLFLTKIITDNIITVQLLPHHSIHSCSVTNQILARSILYKLLQCCEAIGILVAIVQYRCRPNSIRGHLLVSFVCLHYFFGGNSNAGQGSGETVYCPKMESFRCTLTGGCWHEEAGAGLNRSGASDMIDLGSIFDFLTYFEMEAEGKKYIYRSW